MPGYIKGGFGRVRGGVGGLVRLKSPLIPIVVDTPVVGGYFVATTGSDAANGSQATPFATISRAITATRGGTEKRIFLREGTHRLTSKISLNASDVGTSVSGFGDEVAVISGGERLTGFIDEGDGFFSRGLSQPTGLDLFIGGVRQRAAQWGGYSPENPYRSGWLSADQAATPSPTQFRYAEGQLPDFTPDATLVAQVFDASRRFDIISAVQSIDTATRTITIADSHFAGNILAGATFRLLNNPAFIGRDGEFAWRNADSKLIVRPSSTGFEAQGVINPLLDGLFDLQAGADNITFQKVTFSDCRYGGYAISLTNSHNFRAGACVFRNVGDGIRSTGSQNGLVGGCTFSDLASNGVLLLSGSVGWKIYANSIKHVGRIVKGAAAISAQLADSSTIAFNEIQYAPRYGVTIHGGGGSNRVVYNTIKDTGNETADSAAIKFTKGIQPDLASLIEGNFLDRVPGYPERITGEFSEEFNETEFNISTDSPRAKSAVIHLGDLASGVTVRGNVTRAASIGHFYVDGGDRNVFENNISILDEFDSVYASVFVNTTSTAEDRAPDSNSFRRNVIYSIPVRGVNPWLLSGLGTGNDINQNIYYNAAFAPGFDAASVNNDPKFVNFAADDFRLDPTSPALALGITSPALGNMGVGGYTQTSSATYELENFWGAVLPPGVVDPGTPVDPGTGFALQTSKVENYDTVTSWEGQPTQVGLMFVKGDVSAGQVVVAVVDGKDIPCQLDHKLYWSNGSLRTATALFQMPAIAAGQSKEVVWTRRSGTWNNTPKHTATTAITSKAALEYAFTSWKGRDAAGILTAERGPKYFRSNDMLAAGNAPWIEQTMKGPACTEWRVSMFAKKADNSNDSTFASLLYVRAWGGTANNPKWIEFVFRTMHGWTDASVPADEEGIQVDVDLKVGSTVIRGKTLNTTGWVARPGFKGGFYASPGPDGKMDMIDTATGAVVTPPKLLVRHDHAYCVKSNFFPPFDVTNPAYSPHASIDFIPQARGNLSYQQDDVGDNGNIPWHVSTNFARSMIAHARRPAAEAATQDRVQRATAWGLAAMGQIGFDKNTRKLANYLPPERNPNPTGLGASIYNGTKPTGTVPTLNPYIKGRDAAHFPQVTYWTALTEGDTHMRDLCMAEATIPGTLDSPVYGFYGSLNGIRYGHSSHSGQTRAVGQTYRAMLMGYVLADPQDPNGQLAKALVEMQADIVKSVPAAQDAWRGGTSLQDNFMLHPPSGNEPNYKMWMHLFAAKSLTYAAALLEDAKVTEQAHWWMKLPIILSGGYKNDSNMLWKPDPFGVSQYTHLCMVGPAPSATAADRQAWKPGQWPGGGRSVDYSTDGQTVTFIGGVPCENGMILTVTGIHGGGEPPEVIEFKQPTGVTRGIPYYAVQASGQSAKLSLTPNGPPITFNTGGVVIRGMMARTYVNGVTSVTAPGAKTGSGIGSYFVQHMVALALYRHYLAPNDSRVQLARNQLQVIKNADTQMPGYDIRGKTTVPL